MTFPSFLISIVQASNGRFYAMYNGQRLPLARNGHGTHGGVLTAISRSGFQWSNFRAAALVENGYYMQERSYPCVGDSAERKAKVLAFLAEETLDIQLAEQVAADLAEREAIAADLAAEQESVSEVLPNPPAEIIVPVEMLSPPKKAPKYDCDFQGRIFSVDSAKAIKAQEYGFLNAICYMAPYKLAGVGNVCSHASKECIDPCLGWESGQASMVKNAADLNSVRVSRIAKTKAFMLDRVRFMRRAAIAIGEAHRKAIRENLKLCVRMNGCSDIAWEGVYIDVDVKTQKALAKDGFHVALGRHRNLMELFPTIQFVDYTKNNFRMLRVLPPNYDLTFSRMLANEPKALEVLSSGKNVAVIFGDSFPATWHGFTVIDGDKHDLRHLDPKGCVVALTPKGNKAKRDLSGFIVRDPNSPLTLKLVAAAKKLAA